MRATSIQRSQFRTCKSAISAERLASIYRLRHHATVRARLLVAVLWIATIAATVLVAFTTRSEFAEVNPGGGTFIVVSCGAIAGVSAWRIRDMRVLWVTAAIAAIIASFVAWSVLRDESSTAAIGVLGPPFLSGCVAFIGSLISAARSAPSRSS